MCQQRGRVPAFEDVRLDAGEELVDYAVGGVGEPPLAAVGGSEVGQRGAEPDLGSVR